MRLPGMLTAVVAHPPVSAAKLKLVDDSAAKAIKGGYYRPMHLHTAKIGFDAQGNVTGWDHVTFVRTGQAAPDRDFDEQLWRLLGRAMPGG